MNVLQCANSHESLILAYLSEHPHKPCFFQPSSDNLHREPCHACKNVAAVEHQIVQALQAITGLLATYRSSLEDRNHSHSIIAYNFPPEITSLIFQFCIPDDFPESTVVVREEYSLSELILKWPSGESSLTPKYNLSVPFVLGAVCREWRRIVQSTPQMWARIFVDLDVLIESPALRELAEQWLSRSGDIPLTIYVFARKPRKRIRKICFESGRSIINIINSYSSRWHNLTLRIPTNFLYLFHGSSEPARILKSLNICPSRNRQREAEFTLRSGNLPNPTHLAIQNVFIESIGIDWSSVTNIEARNFKIHDCLQIFRLCPRLTHCKLLDIRDFDPEFLSNSNLHILHRYLRVFYISIANGIYALDVLNTLFEYITLPSLINFAYLSAGHVYFPKTSAISFFQRSSCTLDSLTFARTLYYYEVEDDFTVEFLTTFPSLRHLTYFLTYGARHSPLLKKMKNDNSFIPHLESLTLYIGCYSYSDLESPINWDEILGIFPVGQPSDVDVHQDGSGNTPYARRLRALTVHFEYFKYLEGQEPDLLAAPIARFRELLKAGIDVKVFSHTHGHTIQEYLAA